MSLTTENHTIKTIRNLIDSAQQISICGHQDPDGDCIGSMLWLWRWLEQQGKHVLYFTPTPPSPTFDFIIQDTKIHQYISTDHLETDLWISVDTATRSRSNLQQINTTKPIINIDHHLDSDQWTVNLIDETRSSVCEMIAELIIALDTAEHIDEKIATLLYMGISTDTGHFQRWSSIQKTMHIATLLLDRWADNELIVNHLYRNNKLSTMNYIGNLLQSIQQDHHILRAHYSIDELEAFGLDETNVELFLYLLCSIDHDGVFLLCKSFPHAEHPYIKWSLRTKNPSIDVSLLAGLFGWWGHRAAAAFRIDFNNHTISSIIDQINHAL